MISRTVDKHAVANNCQSEAVKVRGGRLLTIVPGEENKSPVGSCRVVHGLFFCSQISLVLFGSRLQRVRFRAASLLFY
jgi:hypothetical protein